MDDLNFDIENVLDVLSASSRQAIKFPDGRDAKWVRDVSFDVLLGKGLIPADAIVGWLGSPSRRKGCTPEEDANLDRLNRLYSRAKYYYGEGGLKAADKRNSNRRVPTYFVSYLRVSTRQQGDSGLGLEAQRVANAQHIKQVRGHLLQEYVEIGSGREKDRPKVMEAIRHCEATGATLIVARVDRLGRSVHFVTWVQELGFPIVIAENPAATPRAIAELAIRAQYESEENRKATKAALALSKKKKGVKGTENLHKNPGAAQRGSALGAATMRKKADNFAKKMYPTIKGHREGGLSLEQIADKLNQDKILTPRGLHGSWTATSVKNLMRRATNF